jgi:hypothetical protein
MPITGKYKPLVITELFLPRFAPVSGKRYYPGLRLYRQRYIRSVSPHHNNVNKIPTTSTVADVGSSARNDGYSLRTGAQNFSGASLGFHRAYADCISYPT